MQNYLLLTLLFSNHLYYHTVCAEGVFFNKYPGFIIKNTQNPYQGPFKVASGSLCLAYCKRESNCLTANYVEQSKTCSFYDFEIGTSSLVSQSSSSVYTIKSTIPIYLINFTQPSIKVNSSNGISISHVYGITEIINNDTSYFIITDWGNNRTLKLNENGQFIKSTTISRPLFITKSQKFIYVHSNTRSFVKLNYDLDVNATFINDYSIRGIHYDISNNNIYIASSVNRSIYIYHTNDEITFTRIANISTSISLDSITIHNDKIYTGTWNGTILIYNKTDYSQIQVMNNMCSSTNILSVKFDCNGNMIYSCYTLPKVKIIGINGLNTTVLLSDTFTYAYDTYIDSKNRLWVSGDKGFIVYN